MSNWSRLRRSIAMLLVIAMATVAAAEAPSVPREFRAAWVATVANIDWPTRNDLGATEQQQEFLRIIAVAKRLKLNALVLQVRPAADAMYRSELEPWSEYLTGTMGKSPEPEYDPLAFAVAECHRAGIELHAWFNPYRAGHPTGKSAARALHVSRKMPEVVRTYGKYQWLDPAEPKAVEHSLAVIADVVRRYDIDGVHLDDYFYPYPIQDDDGNEVPFPDEAAWATFSSMHPDVTRSDWRRSHVNAFIRRLYEQTKGAKPWVKVGISPFGIWRPGNPESIKGFDAYEKLYADARKWLAEGWLDYAAPQLYWTIKSPGQSYPVLLDWWATQNIKGRHLWPGNYASRLGFEKPWPKEELLQQIEITRTHEQASGNIHFSMKAFVLDYAVIAKDLEEGPYDSVALPPASPWLGSDRPSKPRFEKMIPRKGMLECKPIGDSKRVWQYVVQTRVGDQWETDIVGLHNGTLRIANNTDADEVRVSAVSRTGFLSEAILP